MSNTITVLHPAIEDAPALVHAAEPNVTGKRSGSKQPSLRLASLAGKRVALLDNGKVNAGPILVALAKRLQSKFRAAEYRIWKKRHAGDSGAAVLPALIAWNPDLALTAIGD